MPEIEPVLIDELPIISIPVDLAGLQASAALADTAVQPDDLAAVATTGAYADLDGKPILGTASQLGVEEVAAAASSTAALAARAVSPTAAVFDGRNWTLADYSDVSDQVAIDTVGGAYVRSSVDASKVWVDDLALQGKIFAHWFKPACNGVTDDHAALQMSALLVPVGGEWHAPGGTLKRCRVSNTLTVATAARVYLHGCEIVADAAIGNKPAMFVGMQKSAHASGSFTPFSVSRHQTELTLPAGVTVEEGDALALMSNTVRVADTNPYTHGQFVQVVSVNGQDIVIDTPIYDDWQVDSIEVWVGHAETRITNGKFNLKAVPSGANFTGALQVRGANVIVEGVRAVGSDYAGFGIWVDGVGATVIGCQATGFLSVDGIPGGGRIGYGFFVTSAHSYLLNCRSYRCKHGFASAIRSRVTLNYQLEACKVYESPNFVSGTYSGSIDLHCNILQAVFSNCDVVGQFRLLSLRAPVKIIGGRYIQNVSGALIEGFEGPYADIEIRDAEIWLKDAGSALIRITSGAPVAIDSITRLTLSNVRNLSGLGRIVDIQRATVVSDVVIEGVKGCSGSVWRSVDCDISGLTIKSCEGAFVEEAVRITGDGATTAIEALDIDRNMFVRQDYSGNLNLISALSTTSTKLPLTNCRIRGNTLRHANDSGNGYSINLFGCAVTDLILEANACLRGSFRCVALGNPVLTRAMIAGNMVDGTVQITDDATGSLTDVTVVGNAGTTYSVAGGISKTDYLADAASNNFSSWTP